jgi:hypothetical protein
MNSGGENHWTNEKNNLHNKDLPWKCFQLKVVYCLGTFDRPLLYLLHMWTSSGLTVYNVVLLPINTK